MLFLASGINIMKKNKIEKNVFAVKVTGRNDYCLKENLSRKKSETDSFTFF